MFSHALLTILLIAFSLGLDVFAVCIGVGIRGPRLGERVRIGAAFASAEVGMTVLGAGLGRAAGGVLGQAAPYLGFAALVGVGIFMIVEGVRESEGGMDLAHGWGLFTAALSVSLDSLGIGFSLVYVDVPFIVSLAIIGVVSVCCSALGLTFGSLLGSRVEKAAGIVAGLLLIVTGSLFAFLHHAGLG